MKRAIRLLIALALAATLPGCAVDDPLLTDRVWHPTGANEQNIAAQVVNPGDLVSGRPLPSGSDGALASMAVLRLRTGHVKQLPDSAITDLQVQSAPSAPAPSR